jgi:hypothetical protein
MIQIPKKCPKEWKHTGSLPEKSSPSFSGIKRGNFNVQQENINHERISFNET